MVLVYPVAGTNTDTQSYRDNATTAPLGKADMEWFFDKVLASEDDREDARLDLVGKADLSRLPSATIITAEIDPLRSEGQTLSDKLRAAGSTVRYRYYEGVTHEFFGMAMVVPDAAAAQTFAAHELKRAFGTAILPI